MGTLKKLLLVLVVVAAAGGAYFWKFHTASSPSGATLTVKNSDGSTEVKTVEKTGDAFAYVRKFSGKVEIRNASGVKNAGANSELAVGDNVSTGENSDAEIVFSDNSVIRLDKNSSLSISAATGGNTDLELGSGQLWARILKPLGDESFFTIKTSDLSAGVRGTSVLVKKDAKGSSVDVIDSYSDTNRKTVSVKYKKGNVETEEDLSAEEGVRLSGSGEVKKEKLNLALVFKNDAFVRTNTKADLVYMSDLEVKLKDKATSDDKEKARLEKIKGEIDRSLPQEREMEGFFESSAIKEHAKVIVTASGGTGPNGTGGGLDMRASLLVAVKDDAGLVEKKATLDLMRSTVAENATPEDKKNFEDQVNKLETDIRNFDADWKKRQEEADRAEAERRKAEMEAMMKIEGDAGSGTQAEATGSGEARVPNTTLPKIVAPVTPTPVVPAPVVPAPVVKTPVVAPVIKTPAPAPTSIKPPEPTPTPTPTPTPVIRPRTTVSGSATIN